MRRSASMTIMGIVLLGLFACSKRTEEKTAGETSVPSEVEKAAKVPSEVVPERQKISAGAEAIERAEIDEQQRGITVIYLDSRFRSDGMVDRWEIYAKAIGPIELRVYRRYYEGNRLTYELVAKSARVRPVHVGRNLFQLVKSMPVKRGDFAGFYQPEAGVICFDTVRGARTAIAPLDVSTRAHQHRFAVFGRIYAIRAHGAAASPPP